MPRFSDIPGTRNQCRRVASFVQARLVLGKLYTYNCFKLLISLIHSADDNYLELVLSIIQISTTISLIITVYYKSHYASADMFSHRRKTHLLRHTTSCCKCLQTIGCLFHSSPSSPFVFPPLIPSLSLYEVTSPKST